MNAQRPEEPKSGSQIKRAIAGVLVSGALLAIVLTQLDLNEAWTRVQNARLDWMLGAFGGSCLLLVTRGVRFWILAEKANLKAVLAVVGVQNFLNRITPFRLGELSLPYYLQRTSGESAVKTLMSLLLVRLLELWLVLVMSGVSIFLLLDSAERHGAYTISIFIVILTIVLGGFGHLMRFGVYVLRWVSSQFKLGGWAVFNTLMQRLDDAIENRQQLTRRQQINLLVASLAVVLANQLTFDCIMRALNFELSFLQIIIGVSATQVIGVLPLPTVGSVGSHEAGWAAGFILAGLSPADAVMTGIVSQFASLGFNGILAIPSRIYIGRIEVVDSPSVNPTDDPISP